MGISEPEGLVIFDMLHVIAVFLKIEDQMYPNPLAWRSCSGNRMMKDCREHETDTIEITVLG